MDSALRKAHVIVGPKAELKLSVEDGLDDLRRYQASIVEKADSYLIVVDSERGKVPTAFRPLNMIRFEIEKATLQVSPLTLERYTPPALQ